MEQHDLPKPEIPDDISELIDDIKAREQQRQKAIDIMLDRMLNAESDQERAVWAERLWKFTKINEEFRNQLYPEIFPNDDSKD